MGFFKKLLGRPDKHDFAQIMIKTLRGGGEKRSIQYDPADFCLLVGENSRVHLGNLYGDYLRETRAKRKEFLARCATLSQETEYDKIPFAEAKKMLLPRVRERYYHEHIRLMALAQGGQAEFKPFPTKVLAEHLTVEMVMDLPDKVGVLSAKSLSDWGLTLDEALAIGRENLWKLSTKSFDQLGPGLYGSHQDDTHDASRMYLHDLVWQHEVKGRHVVMVPNRNLLLVSGSEDEEGLKQMAEFSQEVMVQPRAQTAYAFELHDSTWRPFLPPEGSPVRGTFVNLRIKTRYRDYAEQKAMLDKIFEKQGKDLFVGDPILIERKADGSLFTVTSWAQGVEGLLAEADYVAFGKRGAGKHLSAGYAKWDRVIGVAGPLLHPTPDYPPRYHVDQFPSDEQLGAMELLPNPS